MKRYVRAAVPATGTRYVILIARSQAGEQESVSVRGKGPHLGHDTGQGHATIDCHQGTTGTAPHRARGTRHVVSSVVAWYVVPRLAKAVSQHAHSSHKCGAGLSALRSAQALATLTRFPSTSSKSTRSGISACDASPGSSLASSQRPSRQLHGSRDAGAPPPTLVSPSGGR